jgi:hypothetical protein
MTFVKITKSIIDSKKYTAVFYDENRKKIKTTSFGQAGYEDYTTHGDLERKKRYLDRHKNGNENWADYKSAGSLSRHLLWAEPTFEASYKKYLSKFKLKRL